MNRVKKAKLDLRILVQSFAIIFAIATEIKADSIATKKANPLQNNNPKSSVVDSVKHLPKISEKAKPNTPTIPTVKPNNPPVSIPEVVKPKTAPLPVKPNNPLVSIPEVVKPKTAPLHTPIISANKQLPNNQATPRLVQDSPRMVRKIAPAEKNPDGNGRRSSPINQNFYHQQTVRDFYEHTRKYPAPMINNQGYLNNYNTYSWADNNRYFRGYNYRNLNYITCYDRFYNRFSIIAVPVESFEYPIATQLYPVGYYQTFDTIGFLSPILMLLRITQGNYTWATIQN